MNPQIPSVNEPSVGPAKKSSTKRAGRFNFFNLFKGKSVADNRKVKCPDDKP